WDRRGKLAEPALSQAKVKAGIRILRRQVDNHAKVIEGLKIIASAICDNALGIFDLGLFGSASQARKQHQESTPEQASQPHTRRQPWTDHQPHALWHCSAT